MYMNTPVPAALFIAVLLCGSIPRTIGCACEILQERDEDVTKPAADRLLDWPTIRSASVAPATLMFVVGLIIGTIFSGTQ